MHETELLITKLFNDYLAGVGNTLTSLVGASNDETGAPMVTTWTHNGLGGLHINGWGEIFRVTQRVAEPGKGAVVTASVRSAKDVTLHFEVCEKHLLYSEGCVGKDVGIKAAPGVWQIVRAELQGNDVTREGVGLHLDECFVDPLPILGRHGAKGALCRASELVVPVHVAGLLG